MKVHFVPCKRSKCQKGALRRDVAMCLTLRRELVCIKYRFLGRLTPQPKEGESDGLALCFQRGKIGLRGRRPPCVRFILERTTSTFAWFGSETFTEIRRYRNLCIFYNTRERRIRGTTFQEGEAHGKQPTQMCENLPITTCFWWFYKWQGFRLLSDICTELHT